MTTFTLYVVCVRPCGAKPAAWDWVHYTYSEPEAQRVAKLNRQGGIVAHVLKCPVTTRDPGLGDEYLACEKAVAWCRSQRY